MALQDLTFDPNVHWTKTELQQILNLKTHISDDAIDLNNLRFSNSVFQHALCIQPITLRWVLTKTSNQWPSTSAVPIDNNIHQLTLILIFMQLLKSYLNSKMFWKIKNYKQIKTKTIGSVFSVPRPWEYWQHLLSPCCEVNLCTHCTSVQYH